MGRVKREIKKIEDRQARQMTYVKRKNGLVKKAFELSTICDTDVALIVFSPAGKLSIYPPNRRIEEIISRFILLSENQKTAGRLSSVETLKKICRSYPNGSPVVNGETSLFEGDIGTLGIEELSWLEESLKSTLNKIQLRKKELQARGMGGMLQKYPTLAHNGSNDEVVVPFSWDASSPSSSMSPEYMNQMGMNPLMSEAEKETLVFDSSKAWDWKNVSQDNGEEFGEGGNNFERDLELLKELDNAISNIVDDNGCCCCEAFCTNCKMR